MSLARTTFLILVAVGIFGAQACAHSPTRRLASQIPPLGEQANQSLEVVIDGVRSDKGQILAMLYSNGEGFPMKVGDSKEQTAIPAKEGTITLFFYGVPPGEYAIASIHDEDSDIKMKTGLFGMPIEGYGCSNDARNMFGPPKFEDAKFQKAPGRHQIHFTMRYPN